MKLVIVQTPAQAKTLTKILGDSWRVEPCYGAVRDFRAGALAVDVANGFAPDYVVAPNKGGLAVRLRKLLGQADVIYLATPPGRRGDLMAWHALALAPGAADKPVYRVALAAQTPDAIHAAFMRPDAWNPGRAEAAQTADIAGRLARFAVSTADGKAPGLPHAGMAALRLLLEREAQVARTEHWQSSARFTLGDGAFSAKILSAKDRPLALRSEAQAEQLARMLEGARYWVEKSGGTTRSHPAPRPLTLASLLDAARRELGFTPARTLSLVSTLYDAGWISGPEAPPLPDATAAAQAYVLRVFGETYLASDSPAGSGIAPTDIGRLPDAESGDGAALYGQIWRYFVASHMTPAQERIAAARIRVGPARSKPYPVTLLAHAGQIAFGGWRRVFDGGAQNETAQWPTLLKDGAALDAAQVEILSERRHAAAPYTDAALAVALAALGFDAQAAVDALSDLQNAAAVTVSEGVMALTDTGLNLAIRLAETFGDLTDPARTAAFFADVDAVAAGKKAREEVLAAFWSRCGTPPADGSAAPAQEPVAGVEEA